MDNRPKLCPSCRKLIGLDIVCPYCGTSVNSPSQRTQALFRRLPIGSWSCAKTLVNFCIGIFILTILVSVLTLGISSLSSALFGPDQRVLEMMGINVFAYAPHRWWSLVTGIFLHHGLLHIFFNMWAFRSLGELIEAGIGRANFWITFMICALSGSVLTAFMGNASLGASNGIFGLMGAMLVLSFVLGQGSKDPIFRSLLLWGGISLAFGFMPGSRLDNWGHIGGLISGLIMGFVLVNFKDRKFWKPFSKFLSTMLVIFTVASYLFMIKEMWLGL